MRRVLLALLFVLASVTAAPTVAAQSDGEGLFSMTVDDSDDGILAGLGQELAGFDLPDPEAFITDLRDKEPTPGEEAGELQSFVNEHNDSFVDHSNQLLESKNATVRNTTYVLSLSIQNVEDGETIEETVYLVAKADGENITSAEVVDETNETVDRSHTLGWHQAEELNSDVRAYHEDYVAEDRLPSDAYLVRKALQYDVSEIEVENSS